MRSILMITALWICSCKAPQQSTGSLAALPVNTTINGKLFASLYQQKAGEYRALCYQAYNIAMLRMDQYLPQTNKPKAIITDIDETILDNSPYAVHRGIQGKDYEPVTWYEWTDKAIADTMPGAGMLVRYAAARGIEVFYITNREEKERNSTLANLRRFNLPYADNAHFLPKQTTSGKEARRQQVMVTHEVILLMGDNLADFSTLFDKKTPAERNRNTDLSWNEFGKRFIVFPNTVYGDWETSLAGYKYSYSSAQKDSIIKANLKGY